MKNKKIIILVVLFVVGISCGYLLISDFSASHQEENKKSTNVFMEVSYYKSENLTRYQNYQKEHPDFNIEEIITIVNMNRDYDFYGKIINQDKPNDINTLVNKYYQLDETYEPADLVEINGQTGTHGASYRKHTARAVVYNDFQALKETCKNNGFELYVCSGYRSTSWQKEIYWHMVDAYDQKRADQTCSRPGHSEHTTGLGLDIALDQYQFEDVVKHPQYKWFVQQLSDYGFIIRYPENKENITGYEYEAWHIRYLGKDLAKKVEKSGLTYDEYYAKNF